MLFVIIISVIFFMFIRVDNMALRMLLRIVLIPVIAGVSYEFIKLAGRTENKLIGLLSMPGLWLQGLTTREPDDDMIEVAIQSVEAVFDWKMFLEETKNEQKAVAKAETAATVENSVIRPMEEEEEDDDILNALDRFFTYKKEEAEEEKHHETADGENK